MYTTISLPNHSFLFVLIMTFFNFLVPPKIDRKNLRHITVKEGEPIYLDVKVSGEPAPETAWLVNGKPILLTGSRHVTHKPYQTKLELDNPERRDTGTYKITAVNCYGQDTEEIDINIICKLLTKFIFVVVAVIYS